MCWKTYALSLHFASHAYIVGFQIFVTWSHLQFQAAHIRVYQSEIMYLKQNKDKAAEVSSNCIKLII